MNTTVKDISKFPSNAHYAALVFKTNDIYHEGDQRSRDCPGHGYPAYTETVESIEYIAFSNEQMMSDWVIAQTKKDSYNRPKYQLILASPVAAQLTTKVTFQPNH